MSPPSPVRASAPALEAADLSDIRRALAGDGLWFDVGDAMLRVRSDVPLLASQLQRVYCHFPFRTRQPWADLHVEIRRVRGLRRRLAPQVQFVADSRTPFEPFPADSPLPLLEWGANFLIGQRTNDRLLLHAGVVERDGLALILPAIPGSGKSTLTAALSLRGWRLMSDEFTAVDPATGRVHAVLKPVALKNESIDVIRRFDAQARLGPEFPKTRKGTVAHLSAPASAVAAVRQTALPAAVVLPRWSAGSDTVWRPVPPQVAFTSLAFNAFNYRIMGEDGFRAAVRMVRECAVWQLTYSDLEDALRTIDLHWPPTPAGTPAARGETA